MAIGKKRVDCLKIIAYISSIIMHAPYWTYWIRKRGIIFCAGMIFLLAMASCPVKRVIKSHFDTHIKTGSAKESLKMTGYAYSSITNCAVSLTSRIISSPSPDSNNWRNPSLPVGKIIPGFTPQNGTGYAFQHLPDKAHLIISPAAPLFLRNRSLLI